MGKVTWAFVGGALAMGQVQVGHGHGQKWAGQVGGAHVLTGHVARQYRGQFNRKDGALQRGQSGIASQRVLR